MIDDTEERTEDDSLLRPDETENGGTGDIADSVDQTPGTEQSSEADGAGDPEEDFAGEREPDTAAAENTVSEGNADDDQPTDAEPADEDDAEPPGAEQDADQAGEDEEEDADPGFPLISVVEAVLFAAREPLKTMQIARAVGKRTRQDAVRDAIAELNVHYLETGRAFEIAEISGRHQLMSRPEYATHIMRIYPKRELAEKEKSHRLTPAALDTLAIIAYKQPVTRGEIERIRGVGCGPALKTLIERGSVRVAGKRTDLVGQPLVYGTTEAFLAEFGLGALDELPLRSEFLGMIGQEDQPVELLEEATDANAESAAVPGSDPAEEAVETPDDAPEAAPSEPAMDPEESGEAGEEDSATQE